MYKITLFKKPVLRTRLCEALGKRVANPGHGGQQARKMRDMSQVLGHRAWWGWWFPETPRPERNKAQCGQVFLFLRRGQICSCL